MIRKSLFYFDKAVELNDCDETALVAKAGVPMHHFLMLNKNLYGSISGAIIQ